MKDFLIIFITGFFTFIAGILLLIRENRLFKDAVITYATVVGYDTYVNCQPITMYTMLVEYHTEEGEKIHAKEQKGSNKKKYSLGAEIDIVYSRKKPDFFIIKGDKSRKIIMYGMIIIGFAMTVLSFRLLAI